MKQSARLFYRVTRPHGQPRASLEPAGVSVRGFELPAGGHDSRSNPV